MSKKQLIAINLRHEEENRMLRRQVEELSFRLTQFERSLYGSRSERFVPVQDSHQPELGLKIDEHPHIEEVPPETDTDSANQEEEQPKAQLKDVKPRKPRKRKVKTRLKVPAHIPVKEVVVEPESVTEGMVHIGDDVQEALDYQPAKIVKNIFRFRKYAHPLDKEQGIVRSKQRVKPFDKCQATASLLAAILVDKYCDHIPCYRQDMRFLRQEIQIPHDRMYAWIAKVADRLLKPLYACCVPLLLKADYLQADETGIKVLRSGTRGSPIQGWLWAYYAPELKIALFDYRSSRAGKHPASFLENYTGFLQTDAYSGYSSIAQRADIHIVHCMAHARRKFYDALAHDEKRNNQALELIRQLYVVEAYARSRPDMTAQRRTQLRWKLSLPRLMKLKAWLEANKSQTPEGMPTHKAICYSLNQWERLFSYLFDGNLEIDNNPIENLIRPIAIGRKNYLFCGSEAAAERTAIIYSMMAICRMNKVDPFAWMSDILNRVERYPQKRIHELLPQNWAKMKPELNC